MEAEVNAIDPSVQFMPGSPGRIGAGKDECLCVGATRKGYLEVLLLYLFQGFDALRLRLARGRGRAGGLIALVGTRLVLYGLLVPFLIATLSLHRVKFTQAMSSGSSGTTSMSSKP